MTKTQRVDEQYANHHHHHHYYHHHHHHYYYFYVTTTASSHHHHHHDNTKHTHSSSLVFIWPSCGYILFTHFLSLVSKSFCFTRNIYFDCFFNLRFPHFRFCHIGFHCFKVRWSLIWSSFVSLHSSITSLQLFCFFMLCYSRVYFSLSSCISWVSFSLFFIDHFFTVVFQVVAGIHYYQWFSEHRYSPLLGSFTMPSFFPFFIFLIILSFWKIINVTLFSFSMLCIVL